MGSQRTTVHGVPPRYMRSGCKTSRVISDKVPCTPVATQLDIGEELDATQSKPPVMVARRLRTWNTPGLSDSSTELHMVPEQLSRHGCDKRGSGADDDQAPTAVDKTHSDELIAARSQQAWNSLNSGLGSNVRTRASGWVGPVCKPVGRWSRRSSTKLTSNQMFFHSMDDPTI